MNILSLFDGMSCGQIALTELGVKVDTYYASEVEKYPIQVTQHNFPNTIQLGDVRNVDVSKLKPIDILAGGSPCQSFSFAGKRKGMATKCDLEIYTLEKYLELKSEAFEFEGQSYLFWEYIRILTDIRKYNPNVKFLLENVEMGKKWERVLSEAIGVYGVHINSALVSAQNRKRIYWTNIKTRKEGLFGDLYSDIPQPKDEGILLKDILESDVDEKYYLSQNSVNKLIEYKKREKEKGNGFSSKFHEGNEKMSALKVGGGGCDDLIVHNLLPRSSKSGKGGIGPLSRNDGKTYCLSTNDMNAVEMQQKPRGNNKGFKKECEKSPSLTSNSFEHNNFIVKNIGTHSTGKISHEDSKHPCLRALAGGIAKGIGFQENTHRIRRLTPLEVQRLQTIPSWYDMSVLSDTQIYKACGNGWTIKVITHILSFINPT